MFTIYPLIFSVDYSMWKTNYFDKIEFVGLKNYINIFQEERFWINISNSVFFTFVGLAVTFVLGFLFALLLRDVSRINAIYKVLILIPWVTNEVTLGLMWSWILNPETSIVYYFAALLNIQLPELLGNVNTALWTVTMINALRSLGFSLVMMLAALAALPKEVEEAAEIDGCDRKRKLWYIILPLVRPVSQVMLIVLTISFFNIVTLVMTLTNGAPIYSTEIMSIRIYKESFSFFTINLAATLTTFMLVINLLLAGVYKKAVSSSSYY